MAVRLHRLIIDAVLSPGKHVVLGAEAAHQLKNVLRLKVSDRLLLLDGRGHEAEAEIDFFEKTSARVTVISRRNIDSEPVRNVTLYCSVLKRENFEWVVQKATEVGVRKIVPVISARTVKTGLKIDRLHKILREAVEQCGRGVLPVLSEPIPFEAALQESPSPGVFFHLGSNDDSWRGSLKNDAETAVWIGPEGGWTEQEAKSAAKKGLRVATLGKLALRAETAAVVGSYLVVHASRSSTGANPPGF